MSFQEAYHMSVFVYLYIADSILEDMLLLLDCLKFQKNCIPLQKQALATLAAMCESTG